MSVFKESGPVSFSEIREFLGEEPGQPLSMSSLYNVPGSLLNNKGIVGVNIPISRSLPISLSNFYGIKIVPLDLVPQPFAASSFTPFLMPIFNNFKNDFHYLNGARGENLTRTTVSTFNNLSLTAARDPNRVFTDAILQARVGDTIRITGKLTWNDSDTPVSENVIRFFIKYGASYTLIGQASGFISGGESITRSVNYTIPAGTANGSYALAVSSVVFNEQTSADYHTLQIF
jgi:hypothetical protein